MRDAAGESVAVGFFDGVHRGHQAILRGATSAITFRNHPLAVLNPERAPRLIMSLDDRLAAIRACGVREVVALEFTEALAHESPETFMCRLGSRVRCGENWHFGARGAGDAAFLRAHGVSVEVVPFAVCGGERVSSTRIRAALEAGRVAEANDMLGRPFAVTGTVFHGKGEGRRLGYPTVNLRLAMSVRLPLGVYAVEMGGRRAIANYGVAPTMGADAWTSPCLEVHCLDVESPKARVEGPGRDGQSLRVGFLDFLRSERVFESKAALAEQIACDIAAMKGLK